LETVPLSTLIYLFVIAVGLLYFLPTIVAGARDHANAAAVFVLNLLLGWTFVGWVAALVWALAGDVRRSRVYLPPR
jgi:Superinfection immunity protein